MLLKIFMPFLFLFSLFIAQLPCASNDRTLFTFTPEHGVFEFEIELLPDSPIAQHLRKEIIFTEKLSLQLQSNCSLLVLKHNKEKTEYIPLDRYEKEAILHLRKEGNLSFESIYLSLSQATRNYLAPQLFFLSPIDANKTSSPLLGTYEESETPLFTYFFTLKLSPDFSLLTLETKEKSVTMYIDEECATEIKKKYSRNNNKLSFIEFLSILKHLYSKTFRTNKGERLPNLLFDTFKTTFKRAGFRLFPHL